MPNNTPSPLIPPPKITELITAPGMSWWQISLIVIASVATLYIIYILYKHFSKKSVKPPHAYQEFTHNLEAFNKQKHSDQEKVIRLNSILRTYLTSRLSCQALFQTDHELTRGKIEQTVLTNDLKKDLINYITISEALKFKPENLSLKEDFFILTKNLVTKIENSLKLVNE